MKAALLYAKTLQDYSSLLSEKRVSLLFYCKERGINYYGLRQWMKDNSIPSPKPQQKNEVTATSFIPVKILASSSSVAQPAYGTVSGILKGVNISLPNGMKVSIHEISGRDMIEIIHSFSPF
jgi:hypothetical protein